MTGFESQTVISKQLSLCLDVVLIVMAGYDNQAKFYVRLVLTREKPSVTKPKLNEVITIKKCLVCKIKIPERGPNICPKCLRQAKKEE
jgi:hypothetical protein